MQYDVHQLSKALNVLKAAPTPLEKKWTNAKGKKAVKK